MSITVVVAAKSLPIAYPTTVRPRQPAAIVDDDDDDGRQIDFFAIAYSPNLQQQHKRPPSRLLHHDNFGN
jgi:hypothetical protein